MANLKGDREVYSSRFSADRMISKFENALQQKHGHRLLLYRQPILSISGDATEPPRYEILTRLWDGDRLLLAAEFLPWIANEPELQMALDYWVFQAIAAVMQVDLVPCYSVNICEASFDSWLHSNASLIFRNIAQGRVRLELSEAIDFRESRIKIVRMIAQVFPVDLDDVVALRPLVELPISGIKIDGWLIRSINDNARSAALVRLLFGFCQAFDLGVTCEYVCSIEIWERLRAIAAKFPDLQVLVQGEAIGVAEPVPQSNTQELDR